MPWVMGAVWTAFAYAIELSLATLSASAALIGAATLAFTSDIAARSGSGSTFSASSSLVVRSVMVVMVVGSFGLDALDDRGVLGRAGGGDSAVRQHVGGQREVHGDREVRVHQRHRGAVGQRLDLQRVDLMNRQLGHRLDL